MKQPWSETKKMKLHNSKYVQWHYDSEHFHLLMVVLPDLVNNQQHRTALEYFRAALKVRWYNLAPIWNNIVTQIWQTYRMKTDSHFNIDYFHMDISLEHRLVDTVCKRNINSLITTQMGMEKSKWFVTEVQAFKCCVWDHVFWTDIHLSKREDVCSVAVRSQ